MRLALVGAGRWGSRYLETMKRVSPDQAHAITRIVRSTDFWEDMVYDDYEVDGVIIASPASTHYPIAAVTLASGVPVLIEKPAALSSRETEGLWRLARGTRTLAMVGHQHIHAPAFVEMCRHLAPTEIVEIACEAGGPGPFRMDCSELWDYAPHDLAMVFTVLGLNARVSDIVASKDRSWKWTMRVGDLSPVPVSFQISNMLDEKRRCLHVRHRRHGDFVYDDRKPHGQKLTIDGDPIKISEELPLDRMLDSFIHRIEAEEWDVPDLDLAVRIAETIEKVERTPVMT